MRYPRLRQEYHKSITTTYSSIDDAFQAWSHHSVIENKYDIHELTQDFANLVLFIKMLQKYKLPPPDTCTETFLVSDDSKEVQLESAVLTWNVGTLNKKEVVIAFERSSGEMKFTVDHTLPKDTKFHNVNLRKSPILQHEVPPMNEEFLDTYWEKPEMKDLTISNSESMIFEDLRGFFIFFCEYYGLYPQKSPLPKVVPDGTIHSFQNIRIPYVFEGVLFYVGENAHYFGIRPNHGGEYDGITFLEIEDSTLNSLEEMNGKQLSSFDWFDVNKPNDKYDTLRVRLVCQDGHTITFKAWMVMVSGFETVQCMLRNLNGSSEQHV